MQEHIIQLRQAVTRMIAEQRRIEEQYNSNLAEVKKWERRAKLAVDKKNDYLAREALIRKKYYTDMDAVLKRQLDQIPAQIEAHRRKLAIYEGKMVEDISAISSASVFERVEAKILKAIEARSQIVAELDSYDDIEKQFDQTQNSAIDIVLEELICTDFTEINIKKDTEKPTQEILSIEKAIQDTHKAITKATEYQCKIQNQHLQAE